jgi:hypothetical protein
MVVNMLHSVVLFATSNGLQNLAGIVIIQFIKLSMSMCLSVIFYSKAITFLFLCLARVFFGVSCCKVYSSGINAIASISTKKFGFANAATKKPEIAGGFDRFPKNFCDA